MNQQSPLSALQSPIPNLQSPISGLHSPLPTRLFLFVLLASLALRLAAVLVMGNRVEALPGIVDQISYHTLAQRVLDGHGFTMPTDWWPVTRANEPTAHWSYLYTLYLAAVYAVFGVKPLAARLMQALIVGLLWPWLTFRVGRRVGGTDVGLAAAAWSAVYGYFAYYSAALMTESFYITAILWTLDRGLTLAYGDWRKRQWALLGLAVGVTVLLRQVFLVFVPVLFLWLWLAPGRRGFVPAEVAAPPGLGARLRGSLLALAVVLLLILPWTVRNYRAFGHFVPLNTNAGYAFFWANHPIYGTQFVAILPGKAPYERLIPAELRQLDEAALDSALLRRGLGFVVQDPGRYILLSLGRLRTFFMFWPESESSFLSNIVRVLSFGLALPFISVGLWLTARDWRRWSLLWLFVGVYTVVHLLSWALVRYRLPVDGVLLIFASPALLRLQSLIVRRSQSRP
ncbi:MAG: glycosyltransferase family 39 protein [Anaerolineae bacterium]